MLKDSRVLSVDKKLPIRSANKYLLILRAKHTANSTNFCPYRYGFYPPTAFSVVGDS